MDQPTDHPGPPAWQAPPPPPPAPPRPWYKKKWVWGVAAVAVIAIGSAGAGSEKKEAELSASGKVSESTVTTAAAPVTTASTEPTTTTTAKPTTTTTAKATTTTTERLSSCEQVREALLTGTQAEINAAMNRLIADKTADPTAREYADYYMNRDAPPAFGSKDLRDMDIGLIRMACS